MWKKERWERKKARVNERIYDKDKAKKQIQNKIKERLRKGKENTKLRDYK